jgi:hypothetical protein
MGRESLTFEEALDSEPTRTARAWDDLAAGRVERAEAVQHFSYLARGLYADQIERWRHHYSPERIAVVRSEDLHADPTTVMARLFRFLGLGPVESIASRRLNAREYDPLSGGMRARLNGYYRQPVHRLARLLNTSLWWDL